MRRVEAVVVSKPLRASCRSCYHLGAAACASRRIHITAFKIIVPLAYHNNVIHNVINNVISTSQKSNFSITPLPLDFPLQFVIPQNLKLLFIAHCSISSFQHNHLFNIIIFSAYHLFSISSYSAYHLFSISSVQQFTFLHLFRKDKLRINKEQKCNPLSAA